MKHIVLVYGDWCGPCNRFMPFFEQAIKWIPNPVEYWNVDQCDKAWLQSVGVESIPTLIFFDKGNVAFTQKAGELKTNDVIELAERFNEQ